MSDAATGVERVSHAWIRGLPWSRTMSAMGPGGCQAVRVRGELQVQALGGRSCAWVRGLPQSPIMGWRVSRGPVGGLP